MGVPEHPHSFGRSALLALLLLAPAPSLGVICAMMLPATAGTTFGKTVFAAAKLWILIVPLIWLLSGRTRADGLRPSARGLWFGALLGAAIGAAIVAGYLIFIDWIDIQQMRASATRLGLDNRTIFVAFALYIIIVNALLEEYVWRWFVYRQCEALAPAALAVVLSALLFTAHHVLALKAQTGWNVTLLGSTGVFIGGCAWSWCYLRYRSIWPGYLSHVVADVVVFAIGWRILFGA